MVFCNLKCLSKWVQENVPNADNATRIRRDCIKLVRILRRRLKQAWFSTNTVKFRK